jgi:putative ABC transport system permease protein
MLRVTLKGVRGHVVRFLLTALAVTLGVAFVAGSFVLRDSMNNTLDDLLNSATKGVDVVVRGGQAADDDGPRRPVTLALADKLKSVEGVASARPDVQGTAMLVGKDGLVVRNGGAPTFGFAYRANDPSFTLVDGVGPSGPGEVVVEKVTLEKSGLKVGDTTRAVVGDDARTVRISGEAEFGSLFGATAVLVDEASARKAFASDGNVSSISVTAAPGTDVSALRSRISSTLPSGIEVVPAQTVVDEQRDSVQSVFSFFTTFLLVFAGISLFVGAFIIVNTFSIVLAQRTRELALLRAVGASRGQIRRMVIGESLIVGLVGSGLGIAVGALLAVGLKAVIKSFLGLDIAGGLPVGSQTIWVSITAGVLVTMVAALLPARKAARTPPVAAMRDDMVAPPASIRRRGIVGAVVFLLAVALLTSQVVQDDINWPLAGTGFALVVLGALIAAPLATRPVVRFLTWPFARFGGVVGRLAGQNALRIPRRTANTASALMIGLTLVAGLGVISSSVKATFEGQLEQQLTSNFVLTAGGQSPVPAGAVRAVEKVSGVGSVATMSYVDVAAGKEDDFSIASSGAGLAENVKIEMRSGSMASVDRGQILVEEKVAKENGWSTGSEITTKVGGVPGQRLTVGGIYRDAAFLQGAPFIIGQELYRKTVPVAEQMTFTVLVKAAPGADLGALRAGLTDVVKPYVVVSVEDGKEYVGSSAGFIDQLLALVYVLLALAIVIAVLGIINTLALSVVERTREIGLLRAVGLRRRQLSGMITIESVATALFGAVLGALLGLGLGIAFRYAVRSDIVELQIPWTTIVVVLVSTAVVGVIAAVLPAVRAVRLNILRAIATD